MVNNLSSTLCNEKVLEGDAASHKRLIDDESDELRAAFRNPPWFSIVRSVMCAVHFLPMSGSAVHVDVPDETVT